MFETPEVELIKKTFFAKFCIFAFKVFRGALWSRKIPPSILTGIRKGGSVTRLGDLLDFGQVFKTFGNN